MSSPSITEIGLYTSAWRGSKLLTKVSPTTTLPQSNFSDPLPHSWDIVVPVTELIGSGALAAVPAYWAARRILGPTFDQIGMDLRDRYSEGRIRNTQRILEAMNRKTESANSVTGTIPPRVVMAVLEQGSWCDGEVMAEYFGGILASSSSDDEMDDRGAAWTSLVSRLATRDVHLHYLCYRALRECLVGSTEIRLGMGKDRSNAQIYFPASGVLDAMDLEHSPANFNRHVTQSIISLEREDLLGEAYVVGSREVLKSELNVEVPEEGFVFNPTSSGLRLFYWAHGVGNANIDAILDPDTSFDFEPAIKQVEGALSIAQLRIDVTP